MHRAALLCIVLGGFLPAQGAAGFGQSRSGSISGIVVKSVGSDEPIAKAAVTLLPANGSNSTVVSTDREGKFTFRNLAAGRFHISVSKSGYFNVRRGPSSDTTLTLADGQKLQDIRVVLTPGGAISGRVYDADGDPIANVSVQALKYSYQDGRRTFTDTQTVQTNDRGEYRLFWLQPGRYYIKELQSRFINAGAQNPRPGESYASVYFPGTADPQTASPVDLRAGADYGGVDFRLLTVRTHRIRGIVINAGRGGPAPTGVTLAPRNSTAPVDSKSAQVNSAGEFELTGIPPGSYYLRAGSFARTLSDESGGGRTAVEIGDADLDQVKIVMTPGIDIAGQIIVEGSRQDAAGDSHPVVVLEPYDGAEFFGNSSFVIHAVVEGDYEVRLYNLPPGEYVKSIRFEATDVLTHGLHFDGRSRDRIEVVLGTNPASLSGVAVNAKGEPVAYVSVALVPDAAHRQRPDLYKNVLTDEAGRFRFQDIPPGDYLLFAWADVDDSTWQDPEFVRQFEALGKRVHLDDGATENLELPTIHVP